MTPCLQLVIVGDIAFDIKIIPNRQKITNIGGGAYGCLVGALIFTDNLGLVTEVGNDFDWQNLDRKGIDLAGVTINHKAKTPHFVLKIEKGERQIIIKNDLLSQTNFADFPEHYLKAKYIHLSTAHPQKQLKWLSFLKGKIGAQTKITIDTFEQYAKKYPQLTRKLISLADMVFWNEEEMKILQTRKPFKITVPHVLKKGAQGACYIEGKKQIMAFAPKVTARDTTGAGDVLAGAFLAQLSLKISPAEALKKAVEIASYSTTQFGLEHLK